MKTYWQQLNEREQIGLLIAGCCSGLYLLYALIFQPLISAVTTAQDVWQGKRNTLVWMQHAAKNYSPMQNPQVVTSENLLSLLTEHLEQASFHRFPHQLAQTATGDIQLSFDKVPYNAFILWLQQQSTKYTLTIKTLDMTKTEVSGVVKASVICAT